MNESDKILKRLEALHPKQIDLSLERLKELLKKLGNPQNKLPPTIHVAGTNGKGSTIAFLRAIFEENNYKVHVYTSPHLINFNERIRLNSKIISDTLLNELLQECEFYNKKNPITFFEITTAAAFLAFSRVKSDILMLETGLGGRFDATNIIPKTLCNVITPISMDHMGFLGNKIELIASEKIGIFKNKTPAIISPQKKSVLKIIEEKAKKMNIELVTYKKNWEIFKTSKTNFCYRLNDKIETFLSPRLYGNHQFYNAGAAITASKTQTKFKLHPNLISMGVCKTFWPARMQKLDSGKLIKIVNKNFEIWLDGGHNEDASEMIYENLKNWKESKVFLIFGMINGKDPKTFLKKLIKKIEFLQIVPLQNFSFIPPSQIKKDFSSFKQIIRSSESIEESLVYIKNKFQSGKIVICGSLYLAGEVLRKDNSKVS